MDYLSKSKDELIEVIEELKLKVNSQTHTSNSKFNSNSLTENELMEGENKFRALFENMIDGVALHEIQYNDSNIAQDYIITETNPAFERLLGIPKSACIGKSSREVYGTDEPPYFEIYLVVAQTGISKHFETYFPPLKKHFSVSVYRSLKNSFVTIFEDITHHILALKRLKQSEERFKQISENSGEWIWEVDLDGLYTYANKTGETLLGYNTSEIIGKKHFYDFFIPDEKEELKKAALDVFSQKLSFKDFLNRNIGKNGEIIWLSTSGVPILDSEGNLIGYRGVDVDITNRKQSEIALTEAKVRAEESEMQQKALLDNAIFAVIIVNYDGKLIYTNDASRKLFGFTAGNIEHYNTVDLWRYPDHRKEMIGKLKKAGYILNFESDFITLDNKLKTILVSSRIITYNKQPVIFSIYNDITERKQLESSLLKEKSLADERANDLRKAQSIAHIGNWEWDVKLNDVYWSDEMFNIFGLDKSSYTGRLGDAIAQVIHPDDLHIVLPSNAPKIAEKEPIEYRIIMPDKSIRYIWAEAGETIFDENNNPLFLSGIAQDITSRKLSEIDLINARHKAEESDRLKTAFLANMSHEIRTPMNGILGFAELLKEPKLSGEEQLEYIRIIEKSGARMLNIINDIIDISKIESGQMQLIMEESNINDQLNYLYTFFKPEVEAKGMRLLLGNSLPSEEAVIKTDSEKVFSILTNLIKNALKYSDSGDIEFGYQKKGDTLEFYVRDTGIGIAPDRQEAIFERFIQADIFDKRALQGAGLGLTITKWYVEMLGGKIWLTSEEGDGSVFYFTLPYNIKPETNFIPELTLKNKDVENKLKLLKILIAEDDNDSERYLEIIIRNHAKEVLIVRSGLEAVEVCKNNPDIDLILMDIKMPGMDGYEATGLIRQFNKEVIIIAQTAFALRGEERKAIAAGCNDYISKPIRKELLNTLIDKHFRENGN